MNLCYKPLFQVRLRHTFYREGESRSDFKVYPAPDTAQLLEERGLLFRSEPGRFAVYAEVVPGRNPPVLKRAIGAENLVLRFVLEPLHSYLFNISQLDPYAVGRKLFCFDNLRSDQADSRLYLGDSLAAARLGDPLPLQCSETVDYRFMAPVSSARLSLYDRFGRQLDSLSVQVPPGQGTIDRFRYDLSKVPGLTPGRYRLEDDQGGEHAFYYAPGLSGGSPFGIIELFNRTDRLTPDGTDRVPSGYRFLDGDRIVGPEAFTLQLERRATRWRYIVTKKYKNNAISLAQLTVTGPVAFASASETQRVVFTAEDPLPLMEAQQKVSLMHSGTEIRSLPNPSPSSPLDGTAVEGIKYSDLYVYV